MRKSTRVLVCGGAALVVALGMAISSAPAATPNTIRVSYTSTGGQPNGLSYLSASSANGRYVAFTSAASNMVPGDTNGRQDVFVRDTVAGVTTRVSVSKPSGQANSSSIDPALSSDGRHAAFTGYGSNLVPGDPNGYSDVFARDNF